MIPEDAPDDPSRPRTSRAVWVAVGLLSLLGVVQSLAAKPPIDRPLLFDERRFRLYATNLADRGFFGDEAGKWPATVELRSVGYEAQLPPGYVFFLAFFRKAFGSYGLVRWAQALLAGATVGLASLIALRLFGSAAAIAAGVLVLATGVPATYSRLFLGETLATFTLTAAAFLMVLALQRKTLVWVAAAGLALGVATLVRPQSLLLVLPLAAWMFFAWGRRRAGALSAVVLIGTFVFALLPWTVRNYARLDAFVPVSTMTWANLFLVNNPQATGVFRVPERFIGEDEVRRIRSLDELGQEAAWRKLVVDYWRASPADAARGWLRNGRVFITRADVVMDLYYGYGDRRPPRIDDRILLILAGIGVAFAVAARAITRAAWVPVIVLLYSMGFFCFFLPEARYRVPMMPMAAVLAAAIPATAWALVQRSRAGRSPPSSEPAVP
jgi:4-amino-4-deoxy-L-arabinose transferase-like glycosyltransferase